MNTPSQPSSSAPAATSPATAAPSPAVGANPADIRVPLSPAHKHRRGVVLAVLAVAWLALALFAASSAPGSGAFWKLIAWGSLLMLIGEWLAIAAWSLFLRRPMGVLGWAAVPAAIVITLALPWSNWFLGMRVRSNETELQSLAVQQSVGTDKRGRAINAAAAGMTFVHATHIGNSVALAFDHEEGVEEAGLIYTPGGAHADPPVWAKRTSITRISGDWARYEWRGE